MEACGVGCISSEVGIEVFRNCSAASKLTRKRGAMERRKSVDYVGVKVSRKRLMV